MMAAADIVKLSDDDLHWLEGSGDLATLANGLLDKGPSLVCITEGANGATGYTKSGTVHVPSQRVNVVDTVGAGDTFNAGVLAALDDDGLLTKSAVQDLSDEQVRAALTLGVKAAAITVSRAGANPPRRDEL